MTRPRAKNRLGALLSLILGGLKKVTVEFIACVYTWVCGHREISSEDELQKSQCI